MIEKLDLEDQETTMHILELQTASYRIEADIIGFDRIPPLQDTLYSLRECDEIFYGYYVGDALAGIISYKILGTVLDIHRVAVHPRFFRRGIADKLVRFVEGIDGGIEKIVVGTGKKNLPAVKLYLKNGYTAQRDVEISEGIYITEFLKEIR